jgi:hypothetical protein
LGGTIALALARKGGSVAWIVPTYKNGRALWRWAENMTAGVRTKGMAIANKSERTIEFKNGGFFGIYSADNEDSIRGEAFQLVVLDEAARISETAWTDAIQPTLADFEGDAFLISTPKGLNWFYTEYMKGKEDGNYQKSWMAPSSANPKPQIQRAAQLAKGRVPDRTYRQEWLAEFISDGAYFQNVEKAAIIEGKELPDQHKGHYLVMGADWALSEDFTVLIVGCRECNKVVDWERFNQIDFTYQRERLYSMAQRWTIIGILPERNSIGVPNIELLMEHVNVFRGPDDGRGFYTSPTSKPPLIEGLANALEHHGFKVPVEAADELRAYQVELSTSGHPKFSAPSGLHDDWVIALALCWRAMTDQPWFFV